MAQTYRLNSNGLIFAPGMVAWAMNGYRFKRDRSNMVKVIADGWNIPKEAVEALLSGQVPHTIEKETVVFTA